MIKVTRERIFNCNGHFVCYDMFCDFDYSDTWVAWDTTNRTIHVFARNPTQARRRLLRLIANPNCRIYETL